jgi:hypothetical protein
MGTDHSEYAAADPVPEGREVSEAIETDTSVAGVNAADREGGNRSPHGRKRGITQ